MNNDDTVLIDAGNTNIKWNSCRLGQLLLGPESYSVAYETENYIEQLARFLQQYPAIRYAVISNVAGEQVKCELQQYLTVGNNIEPLFVQTSAEFTGVRCGYENLVNLGVDRWMGVLAAAELYLSEAVVCIAGCGTATTIDFLTPDKQHLGGLISSGTKLIRGQLGQNTANIPVVEDALETRLFSTDTSYAVVSGARYAVAGMIELSVKRAEMQLGQKVELVLTGGASDLIVPLLSIKAVQDKDLLMKGLAIVASKKL